MNPDTGKQIAYYSHEGFHPAFREDLLHARGNVIILSPFMTVQRSTYYYAVLQDLIRRDIGVSIYSRPVREQSGAMREQHTRVIAALTSLGAACHERAGMHEKVGVIDHRILWEGSLNILSHNSSTELMLRIESPPLIESVLADLKLVAAAGDGASMERPGAAPAEQVAETPEPHRPCPLCKGSMQFFPDSQLWICSRSPRCLGVDVEDENGPRGEATAAGKREPDLHGLLCPMCQAPLGIKRGAWTRVACTSAECDFEMDPQLSKWLLQSRRSKGG